jgi:hypothetical protein
MKKALLLFCKQNGNKKPEPTIPDFLLKVDLPQSHPMDSADTLRIKASVILESYFNPYNLLPRDQYSWWDVAQTLAQRVSIGDSVTRDDLSLLVDLLQNPASHLYMKAFELLMLT